MANWYVAPDGVIKTGLTFATIGDTGYGASWTKAVRWSDFQGTSGAWANRANNDVFHVLSCNKPYVISNASGWTPLVLNKTGVTFQGEAIDGTPSPAVFVGTRDWPWPKNGATAAYAGETWMNFGAGAQNPTFLFLSFRNIRFPVTTLNNGTSTDYGTVTFSDSTVTNSEEYFFSHTTKTDGLSSLVIRRCRGHGASGSGHRIWANNTGVALVATDFFFDSEHQNDNQSFNNASATSAFNVKDSIPGVNTVKTTASVTRGVAINHAAGLTGSGYPQGDGFIFEENVGTATATDILTFGNGDRGFDAKCGGSVVRLTSLGDGTAGIGHHLDTTPITVYSSLIYAGQRLTTSGSPPASSCVQSSGWTQVFLSNLRCQPTATQTAFNNYGATSASIDPAKHQSSIYGSIHQGKVELTDTYEFVKTSVSATEQNGYAGSANNGRVGAVFGLTPSTAYSFKVRAVDPTGVAGAYTSNIAYTTAATGGDLTGPAAPTGLTATAQTGGTDIVFTWNQLAEDAGTSLQGYVLLIDFGDGNGYIPTLPGKTCSPLRLSGFKPSTAYNVKICAYDANMNLGTASGLVAVTTLSGSVSANTPSAPQNVAVDGGWPIAHPTAVGLGKAGSGPTTGWDAPASGTVAYYEIADSGGTLKTRVMTVPTTGSQPTLTKTNVTLTTV